MEAYRPQTLDGFVGQSHFKEKVSLIIKASLLMDSPMPHILMDGPPGLGKTTLARILSNSTENRFFPYNAASIKTCKFMEDMAKWMAPLTAKAYGDDMERLPGVMSCGFPIVFLDEVERLDKGVMEQLHTALESRVLTMRKMNPYGGSKTVTVKLPHFTMVAATNYAGSIPKPFLDRFQEKLTFEAYSDADMETIVSNAAREMGIPLADGVPAMLAARSRGVPRLAVATFLPALARIMAVARPDGCGKTANSVAVEKMFSLEGVDRRGLTRQDQAYLRFLHRSERPVGLDAACRAVDADKRTVDTVVEPWLTRLGFIMRTAQGRVITDAGRAHLAGEGYDVDPGYRIIG
jgi:Holliday junction DNA helicase RuvB